jgi:hypothetical protein
MVEVIHIIIAYILCMFQTNRVLGFSVLCSDVEYALLPHLHLRFSVVVALDEMKTRFQSRRAGLIDSDWSREEEDISKTAADDSCNSHTGTRGCTSAKVSEHMGHRYGECTSGVLS